MGVVKVAADGTDGHVVAGLGGHLEVLDVGDLALGVEDGDAGVRHARKAIQGRLAGVSGGGGDDHHVTSVACARDAHELRQHLQGDVLEGVRGAVVELEQPVCAERGHRRHGRGVPLAAVGRLHARRELVLGVVGKQNAQHLAGRLVEALGADGCEVHLGLTEPVRHVQAAVGGDSAKDSLLACYGIELATRAVVERVHCGLLASCGNYGR